MNDLVPSSVRSAPDAADLEFVVEEFSLGSVQGAIFLAEGLMNRNWRLDTAGGVFALKLLGDISAQTARRNAEVVAGLATAGLPVCVPVRTRQGDVLAQVGSRSYLVSPWALGIHDAGTLLSLQNAENLGALVAAIHHGLRQQDGSSLPVAKASPQTTATAPNVAIERADRLLATIRSLSAVTDFDSLARALLVERIALISAHQDSAPREKSGSGRFGWTHGDLQYRNLLYREGKVSAVLDWDRIAVRPLADEVARTAQVQFGGEQGYLDLERIAAFVAGYRTAIPLSREDLEDAVDRLWWKRMTDYWVFEFHYQRHDHGPDSLMAPSEALLAWWTQRRKQVQEAFAAGA